MTKKNNTKVRGDIAIKLIGVTKKYTVHYDKPTFVERLIKGKNEEFIALNNVNLTVYKGERLGIIGSNGSGKTTLLKLITGIAAPSKGKIETYGKVVSLIDLEAGFHPDLSGIQNIYLNGALLGLSRKTIREKYDDIVRFADIGKFIDTSLFTYSEGMKLRLGFSVAVHSDPDILILDENMAVGDANFREKSNKKIMQFYKEGATVVSASHDLEFIANFCKRVIYLNKSRIYDIGTPKKIIRRYLKDKLD